MVTPRPPEKKCNCSSTSSRIYNQIWTDAKGNQKSIKARVTISAICKEIVQKGGQQGSQKSSFLNQADAIENVTALDAFAKASGFELIARDEPAETDEVVLAEVRKICVINYTVSLSASAIDLKISRVQLGPNEVATNIQAGKSRIFAFSCDDGDCAITRDSAVTIVTDPAPQKNAKKKAAPSQFVAKLSRFRICSCAELD